MDLIEQIKQAGIVGLGGAGFPTHVKLASTPKALLINCAECEPLLRNDRYIIRNKANHLIEAVNELINYFGNPYTVFAIKGTYTEEIDSLKKAIDENKTSATIAKLNAYYPAGDEQMIVLDVLNKAVLPAGLPMDVGATVINVATLYSIYNAIHNRPLIKKYVTVSGEVKKPTIVHVPIGTSFADCISLAGGTNIDDYIVVSGGPMMGKRMSKEQALSEVVDKTTSGILVLDIDSRIANLEKQSFETMRRKASSCCIQCRMCTDMCPRHLSGHPLQPHMIMRTLAYGGDLETSLNNKDIKRASLCSECGVCELYACPMGLEPRTINSKIKKLLSDKGIKYEKGLDQTSPYECREDRLVPTFRVAVRAGVAKYYNLVCADCCIPYQPSRVEIKLKQSIGSKSEVVVKDNDKVKAGDLIAKCPTNALGVNNHASIDGVVRVFSDRIVIEN